MIMKKTHWDVELSTYLDGELDPERVDQLEQHLLQCPQCRRALSVLQKIRKLTQKNAGYPVSAFFATRVMTRYRTAIQSSPWMDFNYLLQPFLRWAAVLAIILMGLLIWPERVLLVNQTSDAGYYNLLQENQELIESLSSNDQVLQFALNQTLDH
jgi:anti-sigma factor RsiW